MIIPLPQGKSGAPLTESVRPERWEHLAGPFEWFVYADLDNPRVEDDETYGAVLRVKPVGKIGVIAEHISTHGKSPFPVILLSGPGGVGKSVFEELLARTLLADEREPVSYTSAEGEVVTLVHHRTGKPFLLNPTETRLGRADGYVRRVMSKPSDSMESAEMSNSSIQFFNAGPIGKSQTDQIAKSLRQSGGLPGSRGRVVIISEFDNLEKRQVPSFKVALDTKDMPEGTVVLCDTNHLDQVKHAMGSAGMQRFEIVPLGPWHFDVLRHYAWHYTNEFDIAFDEEAFASAGGTDENGEPVAIDPHTLIAERAGGAVRVVLKIIQNLRSFSHPVSPGELEQIMSEDDFEQTESNGAAWQFMNMVTSRDRASTADVVAFVRRMSQQRTSTTSFINGLMRSVLERYPNALDSEGRDYDVSEAVARLYEAARYVGPPIHETLWASMVGPLTTLARAISETPVRRNRNATPVRHTGPAGWSVAR
jgi:hypothetical protein